MLDDNDNDDDSQKGQCEWNCKQEKEASACAEGWVRVREGKGARGVYAVYGIGNGIQIQFELCNAFSILQYEPVHSGTSGIKMSREMYIIKSILRITDDLWIYVCAR